MERQEESVSLMERQGNLLSLVDRQGNLLSLVDRQGAPVVFSGQTDVYVNWMQ